MRQITLSGNLGKGGAEWKIGGQSEFLAFSVGTSNGKDKQGNYKPSTWVNCTMPDTEYTRKLAPYLLQGTKVLIQGEVNCRAWISKTGSAEGSLSCSVKNLEFIGGKSESSSESDSNAADQQQSAFNAPGPAIAGDDVPF